jgi:hypothetical protein
MGSLLARRFKVDVSIDGTTWVPYKGIQDFAPTENPTIQTTTDYDTNGFETVEKTVTSWQVVVDPGQELVRAAAQFQFGDTARVYIRWYDRNNLPDAWSGRALASWSTSKTGAADVEETTATFKGDGAITAITNPVTNANTPVITSVSSTPAAQTAGGLIRIQGAYFTGTVSTTGVKVGGVNATSWDVISDSLIEAIVPAGSAGSAPILVTNAAGASNAFPYTRA